MIPSSACRQSQHADQPGQAGYAWRPRLSYTTQWGTIRFSHHSDQERQPVLHPGWAEIDATDIRLVRQPTRPYQRPAAVRPLDAVEIAMGENRHDAERNSLVRAVDWLSVRHEKDRTQQLYVAGRSRYPVGTDKGGKAIELGLSAIAMLTRPDEKATSPPSDVDVDQAVAI